MQCPLVSKIANYTRFKYFWGIDLYLLESIRVVSTYQSRPTLSRNEPDSLVELLQNAPPAFSSVYPVRFQRCTTFGADFRVELSHRAPSPAGARSQHDFHTCFYKFKRVRLRKGRGVSAGWKMKMRDGLSGC